MALHNFRSQKIIWDIANKTIFEKIEANSGDSNGRKLVAQVTNQGITENLLGTTLSLGWKHRKGAKGLDVFDVVDASKGIFEIYYTTEMLSNIGDIEASLILIDSTGRIESSTFTINVRPSTVDDESVESENSFTALTEALVKVNDLEENYAPRLNEVTAQLVETTVDIEQRMVNVKSFGAVGDGATDDTNSIKSAIAYCVSNKYNLYFPKGDYLVSETINGDSNIALIGAGINNTTILKKSESVNSRGIDAVFDFYQKNNFKVSDMRAIGNRKPFTEGNGVTTYGLYIEGSSYFSVENFKGMDCKRAIMSITNWCCTFIRAVGQRCQEYAFQISNSSTSQVWIQPVAWGTGGNFDIRYSVYLTIISPACDHSDAGGTEDDPFLPMGSGGDYLNPAHIFRISASNVTIISPGTENSYSKYIYSEGSQVTLLNPYVWKLQNYSTVYSFIELRGTGKSNLFITNPDFRNIENKLEPNYRIRGVFIESPSVQEITINKAIEIDESFGGYKYIGLSGVFFSNKKQLIPNGELLYGFSPENSPFIPYNTSTRPDGAQTIEFNGKTRQIKFDKGSSTVNSSEEFGMKFRVPLNLENERSKLLLNIRGTYTTGGHSMPTLQIRKGTDLSDEGSLLKEIPLSENKLDFDDILEIDNLKNDYVYFQLNLVSGSTTATLTKLGVYEL